MRIPLKHLSLSVFAGLAFVAPHAHAQDIEPRVYVTTLNFACAENFTGRGKGKCTQQVQVAFHNIPEHVGKARAKCTATWRYWSEGRVEAAFRKLEAEAPLEIADRLRSDTIVVLSADLGSVAFETTKVEEASTNCHVNWSR